MTPRPTTDVSHLYHEQQAGTVFGAGTGYGGDVLALSSGRIDAGRMQLHEAVEAEAARTGASYEDALDATIEKARHGLVTLSQQARAGLGLPGDPGPVAPVRTLSAAPGGLPERPEDGARFADTLAWCEMVKPAATLEDRRVATGALLRRMAAAR